MNAVVSRVAALARFYRIAPAEILVVHDELDLQPGTVKLKHGGGNAGHNGLKDIVEALGSGDFWRLRVGIGHPRRRAVRAGGRRLRAASAAPARSAAIDDAIARALAILALARTRRHRARDA